MSAGDLGVWVLAVLSVVVFGWAWLAFRVSSLLDPYGSSTVRLGRLLGSLSVVMLVYAAFFLGRWSAALGSAAG